MQRLTQDQDFGDVAREEEEQELRQVGEDSSALLDRSGDGTELIVRKNDLGSAFGDVRSAEHTHKIAKSARAEHEEPE